jgi:hypothetical protein
MCMILVIIIVVAWAVILGPNLLKRRSRAVGGINSVSHFHRQLRVLEHSSPEPLVTPAYRLRAVDGSGVSVPGDGVRAVAPKLTVVGADRLPRPALAFLGEPPIEPPVEPLADPVRVAPRPLPPFDVAGVAPTPAGGPRLPDAAARAGTRRRRRDALGVLSLVFVVTLLIGCIPGAAVVWALTLVSGLALVAYVSLLVRMRRMAEERGRKLHYLRPPVDDPGRPGGDLPVRISGRYAHPSNQAAAAGR